MYKVWSSACSVAARTSGLVLSGQNGFGRPTSRFEFALIRPSASCMELDVPSQRFASTIYLLLIMPSAGRVDLPGMVSDYELSRIRCDFIGYWSSCVARVSVGGLHEPPFRNYL